MGDDSCPEAGCRWSALHTQRRLAVISRPARPPPPLGLLRGGRGLGDGKCNGAVWRRGGGGGGGGTPTTCTGLVKRPPAAGTRDPHSNVRGRSQAGATLEPRGRLRRDSSFLRGSKTGIYGGSNIKGEFRFISFLLICICRYFLLHGAVWRTQPRCFVSAS